MLTNVTPRFIPYQVEERLTAVIFADAYVKVGETMHKAGHIPADLPLPTHVRDDNGWGYVVRIGDHVLLQFSHGTNAQNHPQPDQLMQGLHLRLGDIGQLMATLSLAQRLPTSWLAFIDNTAGEAALRKGYGKDAFVNGMLAAFWGTAARRGWRPRFTRVESQANVADAISRGDLTRARRDKWTRLATTQTPSSPSPSRQPVTPTTRRARRWTT